MRTFFICLHLKQLPCSALSQSLVFTFLHCEAKKLHPFYFLNTFVKSGSVSITFGAQIPEWICNKMVTKLSTLLMNVITLPCETKCVKLFITTVMQTLNVMTNCQLRTNTLQQCSVFAFGYDMHIKTSSPVINCLISDAVLDSKLKSFLQALSLNVFVYDASHWPLQNASFPGDLTGSFVCPWCTLLTEC